MDSADFGGNEAARGTLESSPDPDLNLVLLDQIRLTARDGTSFALRSRKLTCLIGYLALQPNGSACRSRLAGLLWSDRGEAHARAALRQLILEARATWSRLGSSWLFSDRETVSLDLTRLTTDVRRIDYLVAEGSAAAVSEAACIWRGMLLGGVDAPDGIFGDWLAIARAEYARRMTRAFSAALGEAERRGNHETATLVAEALLFHQPENDRVCQRLMQAQISAGDPIATLTSYTTCREALARDLGMKPSTELEALAARVRRSLALAAGRPAWHRVTPSTPRGTRGGGSLLRPAVRSAAAAGGPTLRPAEAARPVCDPTTVQAHSAATVLDCNVEDQRSCVGLLADPAVSI